MSEPDAEGAGGAPAETDEISRLLERLESGDSRALPELIPLVYSQLLVIARRLRRREHLESPTWNTTAVVNAAYLRLARHRSGFANRAHFFAVASTAMRQLLIDEARKRGRQKRGEGVISLSLDHPGVSIDDQIEFVVELDEALESLRSENPRLPRIVECRYFGGLSEEETAQALDVSVRTVRRDWARARALIALHLYPESAAPDAATIEPR